ncbi:MAG: restriction endonuclease [Chloroflexi bacterium]|nr:restriction endonuclease [Chloroflexota bacterium]
MMNRRTLVGLLIFLLLLGLWPFGQWLRQHPEVLAPLLGFGLAGLLFALLLVGYAWRVRRQAFLARESLYTDYGPFEFEQAVAEIFRRLGYKVRLTRKSADKGIDIWLWDAHGQRIGVQCKRYAKPIAAHHIREFIGALVNARVDMGVFVTTSTFTDAAYETARSSPVQLRLVDGLELGRLRDRVLGQEPHLLPWSWWQRLKPWQKVLVLAGMYLLTGLLLTLGFWLGLGVAMPLT